MHALTRDITPDTDVIGVAERINRCNDWPDGSKRVEALTQAELRRLSGHLHHAVTDVLTKSDSRNIVPRVGFGDVFAALADDNNDFNFPVNQWPRQNHVSGRTNETRRELSER